MKRFTHDTGFAKLGAFVFHNFLITIMQIAPSMPPNAATMSKATINGEVPLIAMTSVARAIIDSDICAFQNRVLDRDAAAWL